MGDLNTIYSKLQPATGMNKLQIVNQSTSDIINQVLSQHKSNEKQAQAIAHYFDGGSVHSTCRNIWNFLKTNVPYKVEPHDRQSTKTLSRILHDAKVGMGNDCKHYSGFTGAILGALNYPFVYRFAGYNKYNPYPTHVYVVAGTPGNTTICDAVLSSFDVEKPYTHKIDKKMSLYKLSGIEQDQQMVGGLFSFVKKAVDKTFDKINKNVPVLKRVADSAGDAARKVVQAAKTVSLAVPRNAFLLLIRFNVHGWATGLSKMNFDDLKWWMQIGGNRTDLMNAIKDGAKKHRILGFENDMVLQPATVGGIGEPVTISAAIASATPIIVKVSDLLSKAQKVADTAQGITNAVDKTKQVIEQGKSTFKQITGQNVEDVLFKTDHGKTGNSSQLTQADLQPTSPQDAAKIANYVAKQKSAGTGANSQLLLVGAALVGGLLIMKNQ